MQIEDINESIGMKYAVPQKISFSPCGKYLAYVISNTDSKFNELFIYSLKGCTGKKSIKWKYGLTDEKGISSHTAMQRERERIYSLGINSYSWGNKKSNIIFSNEHCIYTYSTSYKKPKEIYKHSLSIINYKLSPDDKKIAFTSEDGLWILTIEDSSVKKVVDTYDKNITNAIANQIIWEEFGRKDSFWWNENSQSILVEKIDYKETKDVDIYINANKYEKYSYIFPGGNIPLTELVEYNIKNDRIINTYKQNNNFYTYSVNTTEHGYIVLQISRDQKELCTYIYIDGSTVLVDKITDEKWINTNPYTKLEGKNRIISLVDNMHDKSIILKDINSSESVILKTGNIQEILHVDLNNNTLIYSENHNNGKDKYIYKKNIKTNISERICINNGINNAVVSYCGNIVAITNDSLKKPYHVYIHDIINNDNTPVYNCYSEENYLPPEEFTFKSKNNMSINGLLYKPTHIKTNHPLLLLVYGGPHVQNVKNSWNSTIDKRARFYTGKGFFVLKIDNRGTWGRNRKFENEIYSKLGSVELEDQVDGIKYILNKYKVIDNNKVAAFGWSYGGYLSIRCITNFPEVFRTVAAGAPVVKWELYNAIYTERYMGILNEETKKYYDASSALNNIENMVGSLLVIHGKKDENVLYQHTKILVKEMLSHNKNINLITTPNERHGIRNVKTATHIEKLIYNHFKESLEI